MRRYVIAGLFASILFSSIAVAQDDKKHKDHKNQKRIEGSGNVITKDFPVQAFDELGASGVYSVILTQGSKEAVKIEADDNLMDLFEVKNEGSKLIIKMEKDVSISTKKGMKVYITFQKLKGMELSMVGNFTSSENLNFNDLKIQNSSVGNVDLKMTAQNLNMDNTSVGNVRLDGKATSAVIKNNGVGSIKAGDFVVQTMDIENNGVGGAEVNAEKECKVKDSMLGRVNNRGSAPVKNSNKKVI
jgi:hypothetical protein